jgi:hypothetical protein
MIEIQTFHPFWPYLVTLSAFRPSHHADQGEIQNDGQKYVKIIDRTQTFLLVNFSFVIGNKCIVCIHLQGSLITLTLTIANLIVGCCLNVTLLS